jgi:hypothetical protein
MQLEKTQWNNKPTSSLMYSWGKAPLKDIKYYKQLMGLGFCPECKHFMVLKQFSISQRGCGK